MFKVMSFVPHEDIAHVGEVTAHNPELILNNFTTRLGRRFGRFFGSMYPCTFFSFGSSVAQPQFDGRRVVTFHNQRDYIFVGFFAVCDAGETTSLSLREPEEGAATGIGTPVHAEASLAASGNVQQCEWRV